MEGLGSNIAELREDFKSALNALGANLGREINDLRLEVSWWKLSCEITGEIMRMHGDVKKSRDLFEEKKNQKHETRKIATRTPKKSKLCKSNPI